MLDKFLTDKHWKSFAGKRSYKDDKFLKALGALTRAEKEPKALLEGLDDVAKHAEGLRKEHKTDKDLHKYLDEVLDSIGKQRKQTEAEAKSAGKQEDAEEPGADLLGTKTMAALKIARSGQPTHVLIAAAGANVAVMVSHRTISTSLRKVLAEHLGVSGGIRYLVGTCIGEGNAYVFALDQSVSGLAKHASKALLTQTGKRARVILRAGGEEDSDGEFDPEDLAAAAAAAAADEGAAPDPAAAAGQAEAPAAPASGTDGANPAAPNPALEAFQTLAAAVDARLQAGGLPPALAEKAQALRSFADTKLGQGNQDAALQSLQAIQKLLDGAASRPAAGASSEGGGTNPAASPAPGEDGALRERIKAALAAAIPTVKAGVAAGKIAAQEVQQAVLRINQAIASKDHGGAQSMIDELLGRVREAAAAPAEAAETHISTAVGAWDQLRNQISQHLASLEQSALAAVRAHNADPAATTVFEESQVAAGLKSVYRIVDKFDHRLSDRLQACRGAAASELPELIRAVEAVIVEYEKYVSEEPLLKAIDRSGFVEAQLEPVVRGVLDTVRDRLERLAA